MIKVSNLSKSFDQKEILKEVNITFNDQSCTCIIGPSGTGKSTLLRCIVGLEKPDHGEIIANGSKLLFNNKDLFEYRQHLGVVFQDLHLFKHMKILENITYALVKTKGLKQLDANLKAISLLKSFNLEDQAHKYPSQLSGGQRQRVAIIRSLALEPSFLLLDEPTSALDAETILELVDMLQAIKQQTGLIIITHDINFARRIGDEIVMMDQGQIVEHTSTSQFFTNPNTEIAKRYIESQIL